jgi:hypothetical protein
MTLLWVFLAWAGVSFGLVLAWAGAIEWYRHKGQERED